MWRMTMILEKTESFGTMMDHHWWWCRMNIEHGGAGCEMFLRFCNWGRTLFFGMRNDEDICERCWVWNVSKECSTLPRLIQELFWPKLNMIFLAQTGHGEWWEFLGVKCFQSFVIEAEFSTLPCLIQEPNFLNKTEHDNFFCSNWTWQMMRTDVRNVGNASKVNWSRIFICLIQGLNWIRHCWRNPLENIVEAFLDIETP